MRLQFGVDLDPTTNAITPATDARIHRTSPRETRSPNILPAASTVSAGWSAPITRTSATAV